MEKINLIKFCLGSIILVSISGTVFGAQEPKIKVRIGEVQRSVKITGRDISRYIYPKKSFKEFSGQKSLLFNCDSKRKFKNVKKPIRLATINSQTGILEWKEERFRGTLHVQTSENFKGCDIVTESFLEDYISSLLPKEMNSRWPMEALKAQAVAARTYAYYKIKTKQVSKSKGFDTYYDLENSEKHQVNGSFFDITRKTSLAAKKTKGEMLFDSKGKLIPIFFHSKCGGKTLKPKQVWTNTINDYSNVTCPFCHEHGKRDWHNKISLPKFKHTLRRALRKYNNVSAGDGALRFVEDQLYSSQVKFYLGDNFYTLKKSRLRNILGRKTIPSNYFITSINKGKMSFKGSGYGHGVGLCQFGAYELAKRGYNYKQILNHYFPKMTLKRVY